MQTIPEVNAVFVGVPDESITVELTAVPEQIGMVEASEANAPGFTMFPVMRWETFTSRLAVPPPPSVVMDVTGQSVAQEDCGVPVGVLVRVLVGVGVDVLVLLGVGVEVNVLVDVLVEV